MRVKRPWILFTDADADPGPGPGDAEVDIEERKGNWLSDCPDGQD